MHHRPEAEREVGTDVNGGDDLQDRQFGHGCQRMWREGQCRRPGPRTLQDDVLKPVLNELANPRAAVDVRDDLEQEVRLAQP